MGEVHMSVAYSMWPRWLSRHNKDVGETHKKKAKVDKGRAEAPSSVLAKSLSLRRANARAKAYRLDNPGDHNSHCNLNRHRSSESIEALYILSKIKEDMEEDSADSRAGRKSVHGRTSLSAGLPPEVSGSVKDSVALVKYSYNPYKDFRDSMMQMIRVNDNILDTPSDLEELLYCYLSLNSPGHYDCIRDAFMDICRELESKL